MMAARQFTKKPSFTSCTAYCRAIASITTPATLRQFVFPRGGLLARLGLLRFPLSCFRGIIRGFVTNPYERPLKDTPDL